LLLCRPSSSWVISRVFAIATAHWAAGSYSWTPLSARSRCAELGVFRGGELVVSGVAITHEDPAKPDNKPPASVYLRQIGATVVLQQAIRAPPRICWRQSFQMPTISQNLTKLVRRTLDGVDHLRGDRTRPATA